LPKEEKKGKEKEKKRKERLASSFLGLLEQFFMVNNHIFNHFRLVVHIFQILHWLEDLISVGPKRRERL